MDRSQERTIAPEQAARSSSPCPDGPAAAAKIIHRPLTPNEAQRLHEELKTTPNIFGYTIAELLGFRHVLVAEVDGAFAGACLSKDLLFGWT